MPTRPSTPTPGTSPRSASSMPLSIGFGSLGLDTVTIAGSYHAGKFLRPHGKTGKVYFPEDGAVYFRPTRSAMARSSRFRIRCRRRQATSCASSRARIDWRPTSGWCFCTTRGSARRIPKSTVANAFGDRYVYSLCPSAPEARAYAIGLALDVTESYPVGGVSLETPGFLPYAHGYHHEFALNRPNRWLDTQLGLCFCEHCSAGAKRAGIRVEALRRQVAADIEAYLASDVDFPDDMAEAFWLADARTDGELSGVPRLALRGRDFAGPRNPRRGAQERDGRGDSLRRPPDRAAPGTKGAISRRSPRPRASSRPASTSRARRGSRPISMTSSDGCAAPERLRGILRPAFPDLEAKGEFLAAMRALGAARRPRGRLLQLGAHSRRQSRLDPGGSRGAGARLMTFHGKLVAITGAAGGIGQALCRYFGGEGAKIGAIDRSPAVRDLAAALAKDGNRRRRRGRRRRRSRRGRARFRAAQRRAWPGRRSRQQRRLLEPSDARSHRSRRMARRRQRQPQRRLQLRLRRPARHARQARRRDRQHRLGQRLGGARRSRLQRRARRG